jgi:hypothetical protein
MGRAGCIGLIVLGIPLGVLDIVTALSWGGVADFPWGFDSLYLWRYGMVSIIAGVLGLVALDIADSIGASSESAAERRAPGSGDTE